MAPTSNAGKTISRIKKTLSSSSQIADAVNNIGDSLKDNIGKGSVAGRVGGWMAGKTTRIVGGVAANVVAGTLKTVAEIIPDASDLKYPETDKKIAHCIDSYPLPVDKHELFELLQFSFNCSNSKNVLYGKQAIESFKNLYKKVNTAFLISAKGDDDLLKLAKEYMPKKKFGLF